MWFNKSKNQILDYAAVTAKTGVVTTDHVTGKHYEEDTTRYKLAVVVKTHDLSTATAEAKVREVVRYTETNSAFDILVEVKTGIEGSTTTHLGNEKVITATIATTLNPPATWTLRFETRQDIGRSAGHGQGMLAAVDDGVYLFNRDLDPDLKLVLAAAMEVVEFNHMQ